MLRTRDEYGGFLPIELNETGEYYLYKNLIRFNCAKAAIAFLLNDLDIIKIYVPYYLCPNVCKEIELHNIEVIYYKLDDNLLPKNLEDKEDSCVYLVDYFGIMDFKISQFAKNFKNAKIIIDNSHAFYHEPIMVENVFNIYSCKKFFGVPDGAYLISKNLEPLTLEETFSSRNAIYLLECIEHGTNFCYKKKKKVDEYIAQNYGNMSVLAERILNSIDYENIKSKRCSNLRVYERSFKSINKIKIEKNSVPYIYPLNVGIDIKKALIENKIYVPTLWGHLLINTDKESLEYKLSDETLFLPLDQRYNKKDIEYIIDVVLDILKDYDIYR